MLFSRSSKATAAQGFAFSTGPNSMVVNNLIFGAGPRFGLSYTDGAARQRQVHQLYRDDSRVMEIVYDALDRQIASTRIAPGSFGQGAGVPVLQYRSSFLDVPAFLAALQNTCAMHGDVADYYAGQQDGPVIRSNDQNYPYSGLRYELSPQNRIVESGKPGLPLSIHDVNTTTPAQRQTTRTTYTASGAGDPVQAGQFLAQYTVTPGGYQGRQLVDTTNRAVAVVQMDTAGNNVGQTLVAPSYNADASSAGTTGTMQLPNFYTSGPQSNPAVFVRVTVQNPLGLVASYADPDSGNTRYVYNGKGQPRFVQMPLEAGENYFHYTRYDDLGRIVEEGVVNADWNPETLAAEADNLDYPTASDRAVAARVYLYDGDGTDPNSLGRMIEVVTYNPAPVTNPALGDCTVTESWRYDALGRVVSATLQVEGAASLTATVAYHYNNLNEIVRIDLPEDSPLASITYSYDDQGQIFAIGVPGVPDAIASYTWSADGQLQTATRGALSEVWNYDSPGNILGHQVVVGGNSLFSQSYAYTPDSQIDRRDTFNGGETRSVAYTYDGQQRLSAAIVADGKPGNQAVTQYDANGNIWGGTQDGRAFSATCASGNDRLASAVLADGQTVGFHYRANGNPDQWRGMNVEYDAALGTTSAVIQGATTVRYARGLNNHRVLRQQRDSLRISMQGAGDTPLVIWEDSVPRVCVWGPDGLAAVHNGSLQYPITDHQHTVWSVADPDGNVHASYDYLPFGNIIAQNGSAANDWLFQYCGKEWDAATGLYDFGARLYDPTLLRFLSADAARQYASPYVFSSNNPLNVVDPSGNISVWAQVGIGVAMALVAIGGTALSLVSFGAAAAPTAAAEGALAGATATAEVAAEGAVVAAEATTEVAAEGVATGATEVAVGAATEAAAPLTTAQVVGQNALSVLQSAVSGAISGAGTSGLSYDAQHGRDFTAKGFFEAVGVGALSGAVSGGIGGLGSMPATVGLTQGLGVTSNVLARALIQGTASMIGKDVATLLTDAVTGQKITVGQLLLSSAKGFGTGALSGSFSAVKATAPTATAVSAGDRLIVKASTLIDKGTQLAKTAGTSQAAIASYIVGGYFLVNGYIVWGVYQASNQQSS